MITKQIDHEIILGVSKKYVLIRTKFVFISERVRYKCDEVHLR